MSKIIQKLNDKIRAKGIPAFIYKGTVEELSLLLEGGDSFVSRQSDGGVEKLVFSLDGDELIAFVAGGYGVMFVTMSQISQ